MNLERASQEACGQSLGRYGFVPKRRGILLQKGASNAVEGWLGLNLATWGRPASVLINPVVGVRHVPLETLLVELAGWSTPVACVSRPLGYLTPENTFRQWEFRAGGDLAATAEDLANTVAVYGQPFIDRWSDWNTFSSDIGDSNLLLDVEKFIVLPLVAALNGDSAIAAHLVQQELDRVGDSPDMYSSSYREFASRFVERDSG